MKSQTAPLHSKGFALIVTLSLMILLTVIAVGLLTLSSISLRSMNSSAAITEARQNARMAMILAVGELQKYAGQDRRATATADIAGDTGGITLAAGKLPVNDKSVNNVSKRLTAVQPGTRYWTGVFANQDTPASIFTKTPSPINIHWLVSGNDSTYSLANLSGGPATFPADNKFAVSASGGVSDVTKAVILAGENTVGSANGSMDRYVVAPLVPILDKISSKVKGRFAWWVGDEGVKAKLNVDTTLSDSTQYASLTAQRRGWETVAGFADYPTPVGGATKALSKVTDLAQTALLVPSAAVKTSGASPLQNVFHSATADSRAVLTDSLNGGTKIDLTPILTGGLPTSNPVSSIANYPVKSQNVIPASAAAQIKGPKWDVIKDFKDRFSLLDNGALLVKPASSDLTAAIAPLIADFRILMGAKMKAKDPAAGTFNINACGKVALTIANPYSVPLKWIGDLEFQIINQTPPGNSPSRIWNLGAKAAFIPSNPGEAAVFNSAVFRIKSATLAPGEARAYTLASPVYRLAAAGTQRVVIDLAPMASSRAFDFNNCIELENTNVVTATGNPPMLPGMDVRESWETSLIMVEMRLSTAPSGILRRVERFELDNGYFSFTQRKFTKDEAAKVTQPFPLMLYCFQISQPGGDYRTYMPSAYSLGQRGSTLRTFADFNLQATRIRKPIASYNPPPYFMENTDSRAFLPDVAPGGDTGTAFTRNLVISPLPWGRSPSGSAKTILFSVPSQLSSLAQLQHVDLTGDDVTVSIGHQPGNAMGNSYATPFVKRTATSQMRTDYELIGQPNHSGANNTSSKYYDISYLLNASLWDSYFLSTIPASGTPTPVNPTLITLDSGAASALRDPVNAATQLLVDGAFNVNSTDKNAWKAFLASAKHLQHSAGPASATDAAFPRSIEQISPSATPPTGNAADSFSGYRRLTDAQLDSLAEEIVKQVRLRGPFVSLSHFVNRALGTITAQPALTRSGALQGAIDESGTNINFAGNKNAFSSVNATTDAVALQWKSGAPSPDMDGGNTADRPADADSSHPDFALISTDRNYGSVASICADQEMLKDSQYLREQGYRSTGIPGWLTQADVLQVIGNSLTTRSDTFKIRSYGESVDATGKTVAKAWCEAVVQRFPEYIDPANAPSVRGATLSTLNQTYGRKFHIISFRWLSPQEI